MKRFLFTIIALACFWGAFAQNQTYLTTEELPDLIKCLPSPPEKGSPAFK